MRTLAFDGRTGASGDMILGALLAAGAEREALEPVEVALDLRYEVDRIDRAGVAATQVRVLLDGEAAEGQGSHRTVNDVIASIESIGLTQSVEQHAVKTFRLLAEAEAQVHDDEVDETHFHEVGDDDAIADVVGAMLLLDDLAPDQVITTPVAVGGGEVSTSHGTYPVPPPAVLELVGKADWSMSGGPVDEELLTPTGAAILAHVADGVDRLPPIRVERYGAGAGSRDLSERPNILRAIVGFGQLRQDEIAVLETNLDDASPELLGGLQETLVEAGALDVSILPATMKKSRPGHLVKVITAPDDAGRVAQRLAEETGTLGVRQTGATHRWIAERELTTVAITVDGENYEVGVKVATDKGGEVYDVSAEYDDAAAVASETDIPIREAMRRAESAYRAKQTD